VKRLRRARAAFTLLEVMVAIAILAVSLTAIFASEAGAIKMAHRSRKMGLATLLARCKMGEIEEQVAEEGLPAVFDSGSDACCEEAEIEGFGCDWEIEPVVLPDTMFAPEEGEDGAGAPGSGGTDTMGQLSTALGMDLSKDPGASASGGIDPTQILSGGNTGGLAGLALSTVYPVLKSSFESQIRRATVTVHWKEGDRPHQFDVTQYLVSDQPIPDVDPNNASGQGTLTPGGAATLPGAVGP
jgi:general secretion pathway protein I